MAIKRKVLGGWSLALGALFLLQGCGSGSNEDPKLFLPRVVGPEGADLEALRSQYCSGVGININDDLLTPENFRGIFNCANYDSSLDALKPLFAHENFPSFLKNLNAILGSSSTKSLRDLLREWLAESSNGESRLDKLLPSMAAAIKNPAFQDGLPLVDALLQRGEGVWNRLLPGLADLVYQERFPDTMADLGQLWQNGESDSERTVENLRKMARLLRQEEEGKTFSGRFLGLLGKLPEQDWEGIDLKAYLDRMNETGVFVSLYLDGGSVRGEVINPDLNADPEEDELREGLNLTPFQRQQRALTKLYSDGPRGEAPPLFQLAQLVAEFDRPHGQFLPDLVRWFKNDNAALVKEATEYVLRSKVVAGLSQLNLETYLLETMARKGEDPNRLLSGSELKQWIEMAMADSQLPLWMSPVLLKMNSEVLGPKNAAILANSNLASSILDLLRNPSVAAFAETVIPRGRTASLQQALRRFALNARSERLEFSFGGETRTLNGHLEEIWWIQSDRSLGESIVIQYGIELAQTVLEDLSKKWGGDGSPSLSDWYFSSSYGDPGSTESMAFYAVKGLDLLKAWEKNRDYLKTDFARKVFSKQEDREAFALLVDQAPNLWLYVKSGASRSGSDLSKALARKDNGLMSRTFVDLIRITSDSGLLREGIGLLADFRQAFPADGPPAPIDQSIEARRKISMGADALKRWVRALVRPEQPGDYTTGTLGRLLIPVGQLVSPSELRSTERFLLTSAQEILKADRKKLERFFRELQSSDGGASSDPLERRQTMKAASDLLRDPKFVPVVHQLGLFFRDKAVKPALDFFAEKVDDGTLPRLLLFVRRVLGFSQ
jgi:hypothetical protein